MKPVSTQYEPSKHEKEIYKQWQDAGAFQPLDKAQGKPFVIMLPPPNITGSLHMGHALQDTIMDVLIRYHRMKGESVLWLPGTDHAALPTNKILEEQLHKEGKTKHDIGREEFLKRVDAWYAKIGAIILDQMKRVGVSADWTRTRFTMDEKYIQAVNEAFIQYYKKGHIYRGNRIVNWDPKTQTTVSDLEIDWKKEKVPFYVLKYGPFEIGTARPETKFGDKYVVMHPDDERYAQYTDGETFTAEWINGPVTATIVKDAAVDPKFGTGVMTITPWHDTADFEIAERHKLDMQPVIGLDGKLLEVAGEFAGLNAQAAREKIIAKMQSKGLVVKIEENYEHNVALNSRGEGVIEPQVMRQWFLNMQELKKETIAVAEQGKIQFLPSRWKEHFLEWMHNVRDWNINRQIWLGHRVPVWWKQGVRGTENEEDNFVVSVEKPEGDYEQDPDVLDTWFSSALWPFATLGWPQATDDLKKFYPTSVLVTGRDILYLWVARMIFSGLEFVQNIPFEKVFIYPTVLTKDGKRMSKSLGTGVDPLELIEKYGADATRFGLLHQLNYDQQSLRFDEAAIEASRNFATKIWNIWRLISSLEERENKTIADQWIEQRSYEVQSEVTRLIEEFKVGEAARILQDFVWKDFADWYVEIVKAQGSTKVARGVFMNIVRMLHPFMPFITEVLWAEMKQDGLLITSAWSEVEAKNSAEAVKAMQYFQDVVSTIRRARVLLKLKPQTELAIHLEELPDSTLLDSFIRLTKVKITPEVTNALAAFVVLTGQRITIVSSEAVTVEHVATARAALEKEKGITHEQLKKQQDILARMASHQAPADKLAEKKAAVDALTQLLAEIEQSQQLWTNSPTDK